MSSPHEIPASSHSSGIRPSVLLIAAFLVGAAGLAIYIAADHTVNGTVESPVVSLDDSRARDRRSARGDHGRTRGHAGSSNARGSYQHHDWGQESELARGMALGLPEPGFWQNRAQQGPPQNDPQLAAMWRSYVNMVPGGGTEEPPLPFEPTARRAQLVEAEGAVDDAPSSCDVRVLPVRSGSFNCVVRVMCDGETLYPNPSQSAGYVPCEVENGQPVRAVDDGQTSADGDPLVNLDLQAGTVTIEDFDASGERRYRATLRLDS